MWEGIIATQRPVQIQPYELLVALFTQRHGNNTTAVVLQFSAVGRSHRAKHRWSKDKPLCNSHRKLALWLLKRRDGKRHDDDVCFQGVSPVSSGQSKPTDNLYSYRCCFNVSWLRSWSTKQPGKWRSGVFRSKSHNYIITISEQEAVSLTREDWGCILGKSSLKSWSGGLMVAVIFFIINTRWVRVFFRWQTLFFKQKCDKELVGQAGEQTLLQLQLRYFIPRCQDS